MIRVLFFGDSFTEGAELWEEKFIPNYINITAQAAAKKTDWSDDACIIRNDLTYTGFVKKINPDWKVHNFGKSGASQTIIAATAYTEYTKMRELHPNDKIICIVQDTFRTRSSYYDEKYKKYQGLNMTHLDKQKIKYAETKDLVKYAKQYLNDENVGTQFYSASSAATVFFRMQHVPYFNFSFYEHEHYYDNGDINSILSVMQEDYLNKPTPFKHGANNRILSYYNIELSDILLPGWHIKHQYHELVAEDIVSYIEQHLL